MTTEQPTGAATGIPTASKLASAPVVAVSGGVEATSALRQMYRNGVHHLAVVTGDAPVGLVTAIDLLFGIAGRMPGEQVRVAELCRRPAPCVEADESGAAAARRMIESGTDALLVTIEGDVRGVLTAVDLVRAVAEGILPSSAVDDQR